MSLRASKLEGITTDENSSAVELMLKKKEIETEKPKPVEYDKDNLLAVENQ